MKYPKINIDKTFKPFICNDFNSKVALMVLMLGNEKLHQNTSSNKDVDDTMVVVLVAKPRISKY